MTDVERFFGDHVFSAIGVARRKPAPDLFLHVADVMNVDPSRCVVIEDSPPGVTAGSAAGMQVIGSRGPVTVARRWSTSCGTRARTRSLRAPKPCSRHWFRPPDRQGCGNGNARGRAQVL